MTHQKLGRGAAIAAIGLSTVFVAAGCSASTPSDDVAPSVNPTAAVTITVGNMPTADQAENLKAFKDQVAAFEELHPNITVEGDETRFDVSTFNSLLVGDTLPTTMIVPRTNIQQLVQNEQVKDITPFIQDDELLSQQNPVLTEATTGTDGDVYGVTTSAYTMGLVYNRAIYEAAGLDPDNPPTTWEEVRQNAVTIAQATGDTGFIIPTSNNGGGWVTTAISNAFGGTVETVDGDDVTVTADNDGTQSALGFLNDIRWTDNAAGSTFLLKYGDVLQAMGAGTIGQTVVGADQYYNLVVVTGMDPDDVGIAPMPQSDDGLGALGGGNINIVNPNATADETAAALEWIKFYYLNRYIDEDSAVAFAKANAADDLPVGVPEVPLFDDKTYDQYLSWIDPYINVPRDHFTAYLDSLGKLPIVNEPQIGAQSIYGALDAVVQQVLTEEGTDIDAALKTASSNAQATIDAS